MVGCWYLSQYQQNFQTIATFRIKINGTHINKQAKLELKLFQIEIAVQIGTALRHRMAVRFKNEGSNQMECTYPAFVRWKQFHSVSFEIFAMVRSFLSDTVYAAVSHSFGRCVSVFPFRFFSLSLDAI